MRTSGPGLLYQRFLVPLRVAPAALAALLVSTATLTLAACGGGDGAGVDVPALQVVTATTGPEADPDGYTVQVDGAAPLSIGLDDTVTVDPLAEGEHTVRLGGLASNCVAEGSDPQSVTVMAGATARVAFAIACSATIGAVRVTVATSGVEPDTNGYTITLEGLAPQPIGANASLVLAGSAVGPQTLRLDGVEPNCTVAGDNPLTVTVAGGDTASVRFAVTCTATTGSILVRATTTGAAPDPDGYTVSLDGGDARAVGINDSLTVASILPGNHTVHLAGVAANCKVSGTNPLSVAVAAAQPARAEFAIDCPVPRVARWTPMTSGTALTLVDVWGSGPSDVFTVGQSEEAFESNVLHYDGKAWTQQTDVTDVQLGSIWGSGPKDVYAVGFDVTDLTAGAVFHSDGGAWGPVDGPPTDPNAEVFFSAVWGSSARDVFVAGESTPFEDFSEAVVGHYDGSRWSLLELPGIADYLEPTDMWGTGARDVFLVGNVSTPFDEGEVGVILHYDGQSWTSQFEADGIHLEAVWGNSPSDVYAAGWNGVILHFNGTDWRPVDTPSGTFLFGEWVGSATDIFAVGKAGTIFRSTADGSALVRETPTRKDLFGVWGSGSADVFAVGSAGTILHGTP